MAKIIVIDEDVHVSHQLTLYLTRLGHEVKSAVLAQDGIAMALEETPDLILLDVILPDETGFQACGKLRSDARTREVPIIMMSGRARSPSQQQLGRLMGANEYLLKPLNYNEVGQCVQTLLFPSAHPVGQVESGDAVQDPTPASSPTPPMTVLQAGDFIEVSAPPPPPSLPPVPEIKMDRLFAIMREALEETRSS